MDALRIVLNVQDDHRRSVEYRHGLWKRRLPIIEDMESHRYPRTIQTDKIPYFHPEMNHDQLSLLLGEDPNRILIYGSDGPLWIIGYHKEIRIIYSDILPGDGLIPKEFKAPMINLEEVRLKTTEFCAGRWGCDCEGNLSYVFKCHHRTCEVASGLAKCPECHANKK